MFHRFTSALFGDSEEEGSGCAADLSFDEKEEEDEWILVDYLAEACMERCSKGMSIGCAPDEPTVAEGVSHCSSCSSLDEPEDDSFLRLGATVLEESWFITPPPCFTAGGRTPVLLEASPLEDLLIEHPSMSVYAAHLPPPSQPAPTACTTRSLDQSLLRVQATHAPSLHGACYAAVLSAHTSLLEQAKLDRLAERFRESVQRQRLSRNALRRLNPPREGTVRQGKGSGLLVHQPVQRQFNY